MARSHALGWIASLALGALAACRAGGEAKAPMRPLVVLMAEDVSSLDPHRTFDEVSSRVLDNVFEGLVGFDASMQITPLLAQRWINPDERTWRFFLDPGARFSDGSALAAGDVKFSLERVRSLAGAELAGFTRSITAIDVVDSHTVDVHTDRPMALLHNLAFVAIMSERHVRAQGERVRDAPLGSGPYRLVLRDPGQAIVLEANPFRRTPPPMLRAEFRIGHPASFSEDVFRLRPDVAVVMRLDAMEQLAARPPAASRVVGADGFFVIHARLNLRPRLPGAARPNPLADLRVRQALAHATDRPLIATRAAGRFGRPTALMVSPHVFGFDPDHQGLAYDRVQARHLLQAAGYPDLDLVIMDGDNSSHRIENALIESWAGAGIRARLRTLSPADRDAALAAGDWMVTTGSWGCTSADASEVLSFLLHSKSADYGAFNDVGYANPEVDAIAESNLHVLDPRRRQAQLQRGLRLVAADLPMLPLFTRQEVFVVSDQVRWTPRPDGHVMLSEIVPLSAH